MIRLCNSLKTDDQWKKDELKNQKNKLKNEINLIKLKIFIAYVETCNELTRQYPSSNKFSTKEQSALYDMAYDQLIEKYPNFKPIVDIIRKETTIENAIDQISNTVQKL